MKRKRRKKNNIQYRSVKSYKRKNDGKNFVFSNPILSNHAIVRYLERAYGVNIKTVESEIQSDDVTDSDILHYLDDVYGIDIKSIRKEMLPPDIRTAIDILEEGIYTFGNIQYIVEHKMVITALRVEGSEITNIEYLDITKHLKSEVYK